MLLQRCTDTKKEADTDTNTDTPFYKTTDTDTDTYDMYYIKLITINNKD